MLQYDRIAAWFTTARNPEVGLPDLAAFAQSLRPRARVLDLGCGDGIPISRFLLGEGFDLVGLDSSSEMVARYRAHFPAVSCRHERVQAVHFAEGSFDAVVAWGVLFHLSETEQRAVILNVSEWLTPGGRFLFTSGDTEGSSESEMDGVTFRYISLGASVYRHLIERAGMRLEDAYRDPWDNYVYVAHKST